jgi:hypothetical protein
MSRWIRLAGAVVLGVAMVGCGANGGDPVAGQQVPTAPDESAPPADVTQSGGAGGSADTDGDQSGGGESGDDGPGDGESGGSGGGGSGSDGSGSGDSRGDHGRKVGLPESIRIPEIGEQAFEDAVVAACGSREGAPDCLTVTYVTVDDPGKCGAIEWVSEPEKDSSGNGESIVRRGARITATVFNCPEPDGTTTAPPDTPEPEPDPATETATERATETATETATEMASP